jgi:hypothetical protein
MGAAGISPHAPSESFGTANCRRKVTRHYWDRLVSKEFKNYQFALGESCAQN